MKSRVRGCFNRKPLCYRRPLIRRDKESSAFESRIILELGLDKFLKQTHLTDATRQDDDVHPVCNDAPCFDFLQTLVECRINGWPDTVNEDALK